MTKWFHTDQEIHFEIGPSPLQSLIISLLDLHLTNLRKSLHLSFYYNHTHDPCSHITVSTLTCEEEGIANEQQDWIPRTDDPCGEEERPDPDQVEAELLHQPQLRAQYFARK